LAKTPKYSIVSLVASVPRWMMLPQTTTLLATPIVASKNEDKIKIKKNNHRKKIIS